MEHSWIGNKFVDAFASLLLPNGAYHKANVVWAGDYADAEPHECGEKNQYGYCNNCLNIYSMLDDRQELPPTFIKNADDVPQYPILVNHDDKLFVDLSKLGGRGEGWAIHPLPLLTCEGNGRGGGDFRGDSDLVGSWARCSISLEKSAPEGFTELEFNLSE